MSASEIRVPNIGDFEQVRVVEVFAGIADAVEAECALISVESDKATMDIPSPVAGTIRSIDVCADDLVSEGTLIATIDPDKNSVLPIDAGKASARETSGVDVDVVVIGGGPGGYSAAFRAADLGLTVALVERNDTLGGVCLNVGCIPSKALLHLANVIRETGRLRDHGVTFAEPQLDLEKLREFRGQTIERMTKGLSALAKARKVEIIRGTARFSAEDALEIEMYAGTQRNLKFGHCIVAAGSCATSLPFLPEDPRIVDSTGALELPFLPRRMLVIGGGIIGLEMATIYSAFGAVVDVVELAPEILQGVDADLIAIWKAANKPHLGEILASTSVEGVEIHDDGIDVHLGNDGHTQRYDLILQAAGRAPNLAELRLDEAGVQSENGFVRTDAQMRTSSPRIFAIGDIASPPMLAHKAVHEGHVAAEVIAGQNTAFDAVTIPSVIYTDPEIAWAGVTEAEANAQGLAVTISIFPWAASGRAVANGAEYGRTKLIFSKETKRIIGGAIVGPNAGDMIGEICLAIEMGSDAVDLAKTIHPHPTYGETIGLAAEVAVGVCTDLPPPRMGQAKGQFEVAVI